MKRPVSRKSLSRLFLLSLLFKAWKFKYRITIPKKVQSVVSVKVSNRNLTESES